MAQYNLVIIGGGIAGLTAAISLRLSGQNVTIVEHRANYLDPRSGVRQGLQLTSNAYTCLFALGMEKELLEVADTWDKTRIRNFADGSVVTVINKKKHLSMMHRFDLTKVLYQRAVAVGVDIIPDQTFDSIEETADSVKVQLHNGKALEANMVIGADGIHSKVRTCIPSTKDVHPRLTGDCTFLVDVPKSTMDKHPSTSSLYTEGSKQLDFSMAPQRCTISWTMTKRQNCHLQISDHKYGSGHLYGVSDPDDGPLVEEFRNMEAFRERWSDHEEAIREILKETEVCTKWRIAEIDKDMEWASEGGRVLLIGDAAHAFEPYAGQGAAVSIEDAAALGVLIARASKDKSLGVRDITQAYEALRRPRIDGIRKIVKANIAIFSLEDSEQQAERDQNIGLTGFRVNKEEKKEDDPGDEEWSTDARYAWIEDHDAIKEAEEYEFKAQNGSKV